MLLSKESPYIRALGLLYIRFVVQPQEMIEFVTPFLQDTERFNLDANEKITIGDFIRGIFTDQKFMPSVLLPRLPKKMEQQFEQVLGRKRQDNRSTTDEYRKENSPSRRRKYEGSDDERERKRMRDRSPHHRDRRSPSPRRYIRKSPSPRRRYSPQRDRRSSSSLSPRRRSQSPKRLNSPRDNKTIRQKSPSPPRSPPESRFSKPPPVQNTQLLSEYHGKVNKAKVSTSDVVRLGTRRRF
jgi:pre-mRNA-splicing factor 38B